MSLSKVKIPPNEIVDVKYFGYPAIVELDRKGKLYKAEYNRASIRNWHESPQRFPLEILSGFIPLSAQFHLE